MMVVSRVRLCVQRYYHRPLLPIDTSYIGELTQLKNMRHTPSHSLFFRERVDPDAADGDFQLLFIVIIQYYKTRSK